MTDHNIFQKIEAELALAYQSQQADNQGRARVCARRAAGWAIQESLRHEGRPFNAPSALDHIKAYAHTEGLPNQIAEVLQHLIIKMEKNSLDEDAYYPIEGVDLVAEAHWLAEQLLGVKLNPDRN